MRKNSNSGVIVHSIWESQRADSHKEKVMCDDTILRSVLSQCSAALSP